ncbi:MAG: LysM peptidoglycan-binding domain-containing protein [Gammaproteobacteria bacterium]|nr:LysM peptidoglycan-binding domain-containing protein [Gammaproteobacteria bacterium]
MRISYIQNETGMLYSNPDECDDYHLNRIFLDRDPLMNLSANPLYYDYKVKPGDSLSLIMHKMYGQVPGGTGYRKSLDFLLSINPQIKNPNLIHAGQVIHLGVVPQSVSTVKPSLRSLGMSPASQLDGPSMTERVTRQDEDFFWALAWLEHHSPGLVIPGSVATGATSNMLSPGNTGLINDVSDLYADYKQGVLTRGQYDYRRATKLDQLRKNLGPAEKVLFGGKTSRESIRIAKGGGIPATSHIQKNFDRLNRLAKMGKYGGIILAGVGVTASCMQIAHTQDQHEKNEIFVETLASTFIGGISGAIVGVFLVSNPIGWGTAIILAASTTAVSYASGKVARTVYDKHGNRIDLVSATGIDRICR